MKNTDWVFDKIVKKIVKKWKNIITLKEIESIITDIDIQKFSFQSDSREDQIKEKRIYQIIYQLKWMGILVPLRNGIYFLPDSIEEKNLPEELLIDRYYWRIIRACMMSQVGSEWIIAWEKALELHMNDRSVPDTLLVYTRSTNKRIVLWWWRVLILKSISAWKKEAWKNMFPFLFRHRDTIDMDGFVFSILWREVAILDTLTMHNREEGMNQLLVVKFLRRYESLLSYDIFSKVVQLRYIRAMNRLRELSKYHGLDGVYRMSIDIIRQDGSGCFVSIE